VLLANGADVNVQNKFGKTVLYDAIKGTFHGGSVKMVELLLNHGVDVNAIVCNQEKLSPLLLAAKLREKEIVKLLLNRGADLNAVDYAGRTAFDIARFDEEIAPLLLKKSALVIAPISCTTSKARASSEDSSNSEKSFNHWRSFSLKK
jgi:ankyrin repeat protein